MERMSHDKAEPMNIEVRPGEKGLRLIGPEFPRLVELTQDRLRMMMVMRAIALEGDEVRVDLVNGRAVYRQLGEHGDALELELVESEMAEE